MLLPFGVWIPIAIPFILGGHHKKILPYSTNGTFKKLMMSLFSLAWSSKVRLPLLITVAFLALDVHLQMEINVFWETNRDEDEEEEDESDDSEDEEEIREIQRALIRRHLELVNRHASLTHQLNSGLNAPLASIDDFDEDEPSLTTIRQSETEQRFQPAS